MKRTLLVAALAAFGLGAFAQTTVTPTVDGWIMNGWQSYNSNNIELKNQQYEKDGEQKTDLFYGVMHFNLPATPEGKVISKATLRLVTERCKNDRNTDIYLLNTEITDGASFDDLSASITAALAGSKLASFEMVGQGGKAVDYDGVDDTDIAAWTNKITLPVASFKFASTLNILIYAPVVRNSQSDSNRFFASEQEDATNSNTGVSYKKADLVPQLILEYDDAPADGSDVVKPTVDGWIMNGWQSYSSNNIELKNQQYEQDGEQKTDLFYGVLRFDMPTVPEGKTLQAASLRLVTERCKNDRNTDLYLLNSDITDGTSFDDLSSAITAALAGDKLASFEMAGQGGKAVDYDGVDDTDIAAWTNNISLNTSAIAGKSVLNILIYAPVVRDSQSDSNRFFASEQEDATNSNTGVTYLKKDLVPQLTLVYGDATGIKTVITKTANTQEGIYNLSGQRVEKMGRGIYIVNGRKVVVK